jgi:DNA replication protein DnaC
MPAAGRVYRPESSQRSADGHGVEPTAQQHTTRLSEDGAGNVFERIIAVLGQYVVSPAGIGKSWLACALGFRACRENFSVLYQRLPRLFAALALARGDGRYAKLMRQLARVRLLVIDDWGPEQLLPEQQRDLLEIIEDRYNRGSLIITSQLPVDRWHELIGNPTLADAILDRIIHNAYRFELTGESIRKQRGLREPVASSVKAEQLPWPT